MSVGSEGLYDAMLQDREVNPQITLGLVLSEIEDKDGIRKAWSEGRVPSIPPRRSSGALQWTHKDPLTDLVFSQDDWDQGAFRPYYRDQDQRYAQSDGVDLRWEGVAALGNKLGTPRTSVPNKAGIRSNFLLANNDFEEGVTTGWTSTSSTHTVETSVVRTGNYSAKLVVAQSTAAGSILSQTMGNPNPWKSREVKVIAYVRRAAGSDAGVFLRVSDGVGNTDSAAVTTDAWTAVAVTHTFDASATNVTIDIRHNATTSTDEHIFYVDDIHVIPTGGVKTVASAIDFATTTNIPYLAVGRCVVFWDEDDFRWEADFIHPSALITDLVFFGSSKYVAFGDSVTGSQYYTGVGQTYTESAINGSTSHQDNHANHFTIALNGSNNLVLWKSGPTTDGGAETTGVQWTTDGKNSGTGWNPNTAFTIGHTDAKVNNLHNYNSVLVIAKEDGLWLWESRRADFVNITQEWEQAASTENGAVAETWNGIFYVTSLRQGFYAMTQTSIFDLSDILLAPRLTNFGGKMTAMAAGPRNLWIGLDTPTSDTTEGKTTELVTFARVDNVARIHTMHQMKMGAIDELIFHTSERLWVVGRSYNTDNSTEFFSSFCCFQPDKVAAPYADVAPAAGGTPNVNNTGYFETSIWNGGLPEEPKALLAVTIWSNNLDSEHTIKVQFGMDGEAANAHELGTFAASSAIQTLYFKNTDDPQANAVGRFAQLRFTLDTDDHTSPQLFAFALHTQLAPKPIRIWSIQATIGDKNVLRTGVPYADDTAELISVFRQLEAQEFPLVLREDFGQSHNGPGVDGEQVHQVRLVDFRRSPISDDECASESWQLTLQEVPIDG